MGLASSASKICSNSGMAIVYGFMNCRYSSIARVLISHFKQVFSYNVGDPSKKHRALNGNKISKIKYDQCRDQTKNVIKTCKSGLVNIVLENYKRKKRGEDLISILFCVDVSNNNATTPLTAEHLASKDNTYNSIVTFKELRRAYKLCMEIEDEEIRAVAKESFKFVKVLVKEDEESRKKFASGDVSEATLETVKAPWDDPKWAEAWDKRKKTPKKSSIFSFLSGQKKLSWSQQLLALKNKFDLSIDPLYYS